MKKHDFTLFIVLASLLMCGAAWLVKNRLSAPRAVQAETQASAMAQDPLDGFEVAEAFGPVFDEALGQWSLRETALLHGEPGAFVRAILPGRVAMSCENDLGWQVTVERYDGGSVRYGGLRAGLAPGRCVARGEIIGTLAGDALYLSARDADGAPVDALETPYH
ncbi:MAG: hypothetical protein IKS52_13000 [Clostridia bacterium]|nr:hypothetical protein [Clostridia bacterium]